MDIDRKKLTYGLSENNPNADLIKYIASGRRLRVKLGLDPTASKVHLGWAAVLNKLRQFQDAGHTAVLVVGDFTAQIGDPTGKSSKRRQLSQREVKDHTEACLEKVLPLLRKDRLEVRYNSQWYEKMALGEFLTLSSHVNAARLLERHDFASRMNDGRPVALMEMLYPLLQAYDSVVLRSDVELGGNDQLLNILLGRDLQNTMGQTPQAPCTLPLLVGTDGVQKMSQSLGNFIAIDEIPKNMFGKLMSIPDSALQAYCVLAAQWEPERVDDAMAFIEAGGNPSQIKREMARDVVDLCWGIGHGEKSELDFDLIHKKRQIPNETRIALLPRPMRGERMLLSHVIKTVFSLNSGNEGDRLIRQGGIKLNGTPIKENHLVFDGLQLTDFGKSLGGSTLQKGKRDFVIMQLPEISFDANPLGL